MNIAVYCGAMSGTDPEYLETAEALGEWIGRDGHNLVYGGGKLGMMGAVSEAVLRNGGDVVGVIPHFLATPAQMRDNMTEVFEVDTMAVRRKKMIDLADAFIALPGGTGTLEEISEIISRVHLNLTDAPCVLFSVNGFYDGLEKFFDYMVTEGFLLEEDRRKFCFVHNIAELKEALDG